jgi:predicted nucleotidyltransferase component of viral defense system
VIPAAYIPSGRCTRRGRPSSRLNRISCYRGSSLRFANDDYLGEELVFRGGTCLHKVRLNSPLRYSEDLDYVRRSEGGIRDMTRSLQLIGERLGMRVNTNISKFPKVRFRAPFESGAGTMQIKVEVNTFERSPAQPTECVNFHVSSPWFAGSAAVQTFTTAELLARKLQTFG